MSLDQTPSAEDLWAMDRDHALHPWTQFGPFQREGALVIARGQGCHLWDAAGRQYLDAVGGLWCTNVGLGRRDMAQAIAAQAERLAYASGFVDMTNDRAAQLSARLAEIAPGDLNRVHFTTGGSTAVDTAVRMVWYVQSCRGLPKKTHIVARRQSYHGATYLTQSVGNRVGDRTPEFRYRRAGIHHISPPDMYRRPAGMTEAQFCDHLVAEFEALIAKVGADRIGGFIAEPIQASGGILVPPKGYLRRMWDICQRHGIIFIADEVVTAFGRLGHWFASDAEFGIVPDIVTVAKGITSGYVPLGAVLFSDRLWQDMANDGNRWFTSGFTYAGHPVACAAALENLRIIRDENLLQNAAGVGTYFEQRLASLRDLPLVGDVRGKKLMMCVEVVGDKATQKTLPDELRDSKRIADACERRGLIVRPIGHLNVMSPPLVITRDQVDFIVETLGAAIVEVADGLVRDGIRIG